MNEKRTSTWPRKTFASAAVIFATVSLSACRSAYIQTFIINQSGRPVHLIEVDYPSASFGTQEIANGAIFMYRFKVQDSGPVKISFVDSHNQAHTASGPKLTEGQAGSLTITVGGDEKVSWGSRLSPSK